MNESKFKTTMKLIGFHIRNLLRGLGRTLYGTFIAGLLGFAVYGFVIIGSEDGYAAVFDFIASCAILLFALGNAYLLGCNKRGKKR